MNLKLTLAALLIVPVMLTACGKKEESSNAGQDAASTRYLSRRRRHWSTQRLARSRRAATHQPGGHRGERRGRFLRIDQSAVGSRRTQVEKWCLYQSGRRRAAR